MNNGFWNKTAALWYVCAACLCSAAVSDVSGQSPAVPSAETAIQEILTGKQDTDTSINAVVDAITETVSAKPVTVETVKSAIEGPLVVEEQPVPETNQKAAEAVDTKTGRYPPRLIIDFSEFPLRQLVNWKTDSDSEVTHETGFDSAKRIKERIREPGLRITFKERTAVVRGTVTTERKRTVVEIMLRLEPGIDRVDWKAVTQR